MHMRACLKKLNSNLITCSEEGAGERKQGNRSNWIDLNCGHEDRKQHSIIRRKIVAVMLTTDRKKPTSDPVQPGSGQTPSGSSCGRY